MLILAIDSTAVCASAALCEDESIVAEFFLHTKLTHSRTLMPMVQSVLSAADKKLSDIDLLAVNAGPGSFTGVRIGVATVKGLAMPLQIPCAAVSTLESMAYSLRHWNGVLCAVMDARCGQVYNALFRIQDGSIARLCEDRAIAVTELAAECAGFGERVLLVGDGAELCAKNVAFADCAVLAPEKLRYQTASGVAFAACGLPEEKICSAAALQPFYLRPPQAEQQKDRK